MEQLLPRFRTAHTQVLGISVDSIFCHANWAQSLGGVSFPLLADFHPRGAVAESYGLFLENAGITDRATVVIDATGIVRHASSVTPAGQRDISDLAALCEGIDREHGSGLTDFPAPRGLGPAETLYVKSNCGHSRKVLLCRDNLHLKDRLEVRNVTEDPQAREALARAAGNDQAPCLIVGGKPMHEGDEIVRYLVEASTDIVG